MTRDQARKAFTEDLFSVPGVVGQIHESTQELEDGSTVVIWYGYLSSTNGPQSRSPVPDRAVKIVLRENKVVAVSKSR